MIEKCLVLWIGRDISPPAKCRASSYAFFKLEEADECEEVETTDPVEVAERVVGNESDLDEPWPCAVEVDAMLEFVSVRAGLE